MAKAPVTDLVVVLPGIMGSTLVRDGRELWNSRIAVMGRHLLRGMRDLERLVLPPGIGDDDPQDGVEAVALLPGLHLLPGVSAIDGYAGLLGFLERRFDFSGGNLLPFPYDWRLSVRLNARRLGSAVSAALGDWRERSGNPGARTVLIAHSMGGLIAAHYLDVLGGRADARTLITMGTPFRGSLNALAVLNAGVLPGLGGFAEPVTRLARSLPSLHQLLPDWPCVVGADGARTGLDRVELPGADPQLTADAHRLRAELANAAGALDAGYRTHVFGGFRQPTGQSATPGPAGGPFRTSRSLDGVDRDGDGTVPRFSCFPAHHADDSEVRYVAQRHGSLQNHPALWHQVEAILTAQAPRNFLDGGPELSLDLPDAVFDGRCPVHVTADGGRPALGVTAEDVETGARTGPRGLRHRGDGRYGTTLELPGPGTFRIAVADPADPAAHPVVGFVQSFPAA
ncbi:esterase/lipase family protein [Kitasatospora phosalacinea]|uniref:Esterase/lipase family protein n=1 Tax=Kitasatospora phosalacinea TaxID=2065 RepID=A0ABW6GJH9_9ACTN